jgi:hypothetical protein
MNSRLISPGVQHSAVTKDPRTCRHESLEHLGTEDHAQFYKCEACGDVFVVDAGHMWHVEGVPA